MFNKFTDYCVKFSIPAGAIIYILFFRNTSGLINTILYALAYGFITFFLTAVLVTIFTAAFESNYGKYLCPCIVVIIIGICVNYFDHKNSQLNELKEENRMMKDDLDYFEQVVEDYKDQIYELEDQLYDFENNIYY